MGKKRHKPDKQILAEARLGKRTEPCAPARLH